MSLCDDEQKASINALLALSKDELSTKIKAGDNAVAEAEATFKSEVDKLQAKYKELEKAKEVSIASIKDSGLGLMKQVLHFVK